jgi:hypothetical protein
MNLSVIRYYGLRHKSNFQIQAKFCLIYGKVAVCPCTVNTWAVHFRSGRISVEDHIFGRFYSWRVCFHRRTSEKVLKRERFNSAFFTLTILLNITGSMSMHRPKIRTQGHWLLIDNVKPHKNALSLQKTKEARFTRLPQLPYSYDLILCDFLFEYLKKEWEGKNYRSESQVISAVGLIFKRPP